MIFDYIMIIIKSENIRITHFTVNTVTKQVLFVFIDHLVVRNMMYLYTLVCHSLDVTFDMKLTCMTFLYKLRYVNNR